MDVERPAAHYALCRNEAGWVNLLAVEVGEALVPQKVSDHHGFTIEGAANLIDELRQSALAAAEALGISKVLPATRQHGSYSFYLQDVDTNCWELEIWDEGISPVDRALAGRPLNSPKGGS